MKSQLYGHLWTGGWAAPTEYVELVLCRDVYHCPPTELAQQPLRKVMAHLACLEVEGKVREAKSSQPVKRGGQTFH